MEDILIKKICNVISNIVLAIFIAYFISYSFATKYMQQGSSMSPTISDGDILLVNRLYSNLLKIKRNDIIYFNKNGQDSVKRVYGLPGDVIDITNGYLYVNNVRLDNVNLRHSLSSNVTQNLVIGDDEYYVLGDSLDSSKDSRHVDVGNINSKDIIGKVWWIIRR